MTDQPVQTPEPAAGDAPGGLPRRSRLQLSLLTLLLLLVLAASLFALLRDTRAWVPGVVVKTGTSESGFNANAILLDEGRLVAASTGRSVSETDRVLLIDAGTGRLLAEQKTSPDMICGFLPDGRYVTASKEPPLVRISCPRNTRDPIEIRGFTGSVVCMRASMTGNRILILTSDGAAGVWDVVTGRKQCDLDTRSFGFASKEDRESSEISPKGKHVAAYMHDQKRACVWNADTGALKAGVSSEIQDELRFVLDGTAVLLRTGETTLGVIDADTGQAVSSLEAPDGWAGLWIRSSTISPDGCRLLIYEWGSEEAWEWDTRSGSKRQLNLKDRETMSAWEVIPCPYMHYSPDHSRLISASYLLCPNLGIWDTETGQLLTVLSKESPGGGGLSFAFSPDGRRIAVLHEDGALRVWTRRRPEAWWGFVALLEFWTTILATAALVVIMVRHLKRPPVSPSLNP